MKLTIKNNNLISCLKLGSALLLLLFVFSSCGDEVKIEDVNLDVTPETDVQPQEMVVISYNILEGMKEDKANNFDNFVEWVKLQAPDVLAIQEANNFTQESLSELAARYGHSYAVYNKKGSFPVSITSKYPIEVRSHMVDDRVYHGGVHVTIKGINFVVLHLYPFQTAYGGYENGDEYRVSEVETYLGNTILKYPVEPYWLMMGDFNTYSPLDQEYYVEMGKKLNYDVHSLMLRSGYSDTYSEKHNYFTHTVPTKMNNGEIKRRLDFIYGSSNVSRNIISSSMIVDEFTDIYSDHYPCKVIFRYFEDSEALSN